MIKGSTTVVVTGGAGFIGSHLTHALLREGFRVRVVDDLSTGKIRNLEEAAGCSFPNDGKQEKDRNPVRLGDRAELIRGDISDLPTCRAACEGASFVFHLAALGSVQRSVEDPLTSHRINATGTLNLLQAAREGGVKRLVDSAFDLVTIIFHPLLPHNSKPFRPVIFFALQNFCVIQLSP